MPLKRPKLADEDIATIRQWIEDGASLEAVDDAVPEEQRTSEARAVLENRAIRPQERQYWAFQKPRRPPLPVIAPMPALTPAGAHPSPSPNPIDAFLLASMSAKGLTPAPRADRRTLIRRAYLDVLGLPPSPDEVDAFVNDRSPDAWPKLVDRLLASPHYGERWARHWLDLVRYADSGGFEFDVDRREAWRYRDYVVERVQQRQAVRRSSSGSRSPATSTSPTGDCSDRRAMIATGFLRLGPEGGGGGERGRQDALEDVIATTTADVHGPDRRAARAATTTSSTRSRRRTTTGSRRSSPRRGRRSIRWCRRTKCSAHRSRDGADRRVCSSRCGRPSGTSRRRT